MAAPVCASMSHLRDLDAALDLDGDGDGRLTWGEVKAAWPAIDAYVQRNVQAASAADSIIRRRPSRSAPMASMRRCNIRAAVPAQGCDR